jgi:hypothetical protein
MAYGAPRLKYRDTPPYTWLSLLIQTISISLGHFVWFVCNSRMFFSEGQRLLLLEVLKEAYFKNNLEFFKTNFFI